MNEPCGACGGQRDPVLLPGGSGSSGPVRAVAEARPGARCRSCGAVVRSAGPAGALALAVDRAVATQLVVGTPGRIGRSPVARCGSCSALLELPLRATTRAVTVEPTDAPPFTVTLQLPIVRCGGCGLDNVPPQVGPDVRRSALGACGLDPSGPADPEGSARSIAGGLAGSLRRLRRRGGPGSPGRP